MNLMLIDIDYERAQGDYKRVCEPSLGAILRGVGGDYDGGEEEGANHRERVWPLYT